MQNIDMEGSGVALHDFYGLPVAEPMKMGLLGVL